MSRTQLAFNSGDLAFQEIITSRPTATPLINTSAFVVTNPTDDSITSGLPVIQTRSVRPAWSLPRLCGFITADTAGRLLLLLVEHLLYVESDVSVATNIVVTHLRMSIGIRNAT